MDEAEKWRARAARYREFAELAMDGTARSRRIARAQNFERLADELDGAEPAASASIPAFAGLRRTLSRVAAGLWTVATF
jgi:hypothetical protein